MAVIDTANAFMQTDFEGEKVVVKVRGKLAEMLASASPESPNICLATSKCPFLGAAANLLRDETAQLMSMLPEETNH